MRLIDSLFRRRATVCRTCGAPLVHATAAVLTGRAHPLVVELFGVPVVRCPAGHETAVARTLHDDLFVAALAEEQIPTAIARPLAAALCSGCGARLEAAHVTQCAREYVVTLGDGREQRMRVTGPHVQCSRCGAWQVSSANGDAALVRALRHAVTADQNGASFSTK